MQELLLRAPALALLRVQQVVVLVVVLPVVLVAELLGVPQVQAPPVPIYSQQNPLLVQVLAQHSFQGIQQVSMPQIT